MLFLFLCGVGAAAADVEPRGPDIAPIVEIRRLIEAEMKSHDVPGLSIALIDAERLRWSQGFGLADVDRRRRVTHSTLFPAGTLTMPLTASAVMQRMEDGGLELDAAAARYLPEFAPRTRYPQAGPITVRQLLSHHSGLPAMHFQGMMAKHPLSLAAFMTRLRDEYVVAPPQHVYVFSHPGYAVLGRLLEQQGDGSYAEQLRTNLLEPLGMRRATFTPDTGDTNISLSYRKRARFPRLPVRDLPAIGLYSSAEELAYFAQMLLNEGRVGERRVLQAASVAEMFRAQNRDVTLDLQNHVGLGWRLKGMTIEGARRVVWQDGSSPFSGGRIIILPDDRLALVILGNGNKMWAVAETVGQRLLGGLLARTKPSAHAAKSEMTVAVAEERGKPPALSGHYVTPLGLVTVRGEGKDLKADVFGKTVELVRHPTGWIGVEYRLLGLLPIPIATLNEARLWPSVSHGRTTALLDHKNELRRFAEQLPTTTLSTAWRRRLGRYAVIDRDPILDILETREIVLKYDNQVAYFDFRLPGWLGLHSQIPVLPVSDTELVVAGTGWLMGDTIGVVQVDGQERLVYSGYQFRRIRD